MNSTNTAFVSAITVLRNATTVEQFQAAALALVPNTNGNYMAAMVIMDSAKLMRYETTVVQMQLWNTVATVLHEVARITNDKNTKAAIVEMELTSKLASLLYS